MSLDPGNEKSQVIQKRDKTIISTSENSKIADKTEESLDDENKRRCKELSSVERELDAEIEKMKAELEAGPSMKDTMDRLHEYNEIKDATQIVLGAMANMYGVTIASLHEEYNLPKGED